MRDPLNGEAVRPEALKEAIATCAFTASVLIVPETLFHHTAMLIAAHGEGTWLVAEYRRLGLRRIMWAEDVADGEFLLSSGAELPSGIETLDLGG